MILGVVNWFAVFGEIRLDMRLSKTQTMRVREKVSLAASLKTGSFKQEYLQGYDRR